MSSHIKADKIFDPAKTWFISDPHFAHANVLKFESEFHSFNSIDEHDQAIIDGWNRLVQEDDTVFFLGDASMPRIKLNYLKEIFSKLKGKIVWLRGNHDDHIDPWLWELKKVANIVEFKDYEEIFFSDLTHKSGLRRVVLFHYPILEFNGKFHDSYHLYGHSHDVVHPIKNAYSVCACITGYSPVNFEWVQQKIQEHNYGLDRLGQSSLLSAN